jgi:putative ABC transport system permease protein
MFLNIAFQNLLRNKRRTLFTELAIVFGVVVVIFTGAFLKGMFRFWAQDVFINATTGAFQIEHWNYRAESTLDPLGTTLTNSAELIAAVERMPGVGAAYGELRIIGIVSNGSRSDVFDGKGVDKDGQRRVLPGADNLVRAGRSLGDDPNEVVLGQLLAEKLGVTVGGQVIIVVKTLQGGIDLMYGKVVGVKSGSHFPSATYLEMNLSRAQKFLRMPNRVSQILVKTTDFDRARQVAGSAAVALKHAGTPVIVRDYTELIPMYVTVGSVFKLIASTISLILFVIIGLGIANAMFVAIRERRKEIGTLLAIGMEPYQARRMFILEGMMIGLLGAVIGLVFVAALTHVISGNGGLRFNGPDAAIITVFPQIDWLIAGLALLLSVVISIVASWFPASASAKLNPVEALTEA